MEESIENRTIINELLFILRGCPVRFVRVIVAQNAALLLPPLPQALMLTLILLLFLGRPCLQNQ